jgi:hypothetical protein
VCQNQQSSRRHKSGRDELSPGSPDERDPDEKVHLLGKQAALSAVALTPIAQALMLPRRAAARSSPIASLYILMSEASQTTSRIAKVDQYAGVPPWTCATRRKETVMAMVPKIVAKKQLQQRIKASFESCRRWETVASSERMGMTPPSSAQDF